MQPKGFPTPRMGLLIVDLFALYIDINGNVNLERYRWLMYMSEICLMKYIARLAFGPRIVVAAQKRKSETLLKQQLTRRARIRPGSVLVSIAREAGGLTDAEARSFDTLRDTSPAGPVRFD
jgi:hypothetical protein